MDGLRQINEEIKLRLLALLQEAAQAKMMLINLGTPDHSLGKGKRPTKTKSEKGGCFSFRQTVLQYEI